MPDITLTLNQDQHRRLTEEHERMLIAWPGSTRDAPPTFEQWLVAQLEQSAPGASLQQREAEEMRLVDALEKLITLLQAHGFALAQIDQRERKDAAEALARVFATNLGLTRQRARRVQELFAYYAKGAREVADAAKLITTNRGYGALHEACRAVTERTAKAAARLGDDRALGRVEGALAILVILQVMTRESARERTDAFKSQLQ